MKAVLIARVSTQEQKEAGNSLPAQVTRLESYCKNKGLEIFKVCSFDESAYGNEREEFDRIIDFILTHQEKLIVCCDKVDRLSRNIFDKRIALLYERALKDEIELHFASEGQVITSKISAVEKFQFSMSLGLAKYYSDSISDNVKRAIEQKLRKGEWPGKAPFGYKNVRTTNTTDVIVDDYNARLVQKAFEFYATGAYSMDLLRKKFHDEYGIKWSKGVLDFILKNPFYAGTMLYNGQLYPHRYPPIITQALFDQVQAVKKSFNKKQFKFAGQPYIYRGLIRCATCGLAITPEKHKGHVYYHCTQYNGKHGAKWIREEAITNQLTWLFKRLHVPQDILESITNMLTELHQQKVEFHAMHYDRLTKEQKKLTQMLENLYFDKLKGRITEDEYDKFYTTLRDQAAEIATQLNNLQEAENNYYITSKQLLDLITRAHELFLSSEVEEKRHLIKLILSNLTLDNEKLVWELHKPFDLLIKCTDDQEWLPE